MGFGHRLDELLKERGRTRSWLAGCLQVDGAGVDGWCSGTALPDELTLQAIASALAVDVGHLVTDERPGHRRRRTIHRTRRFFRRTRL